MCTNINFQENNPADYDIEAMGTLRRQTVGLSVYTAKHTNKPFLSPVHHLPSPKAPLILPQMPFFRTTMSTSFRPIRPIMPATSPLRSCQSLRATSSSASTLVLQSNNRKDQNLLGAVGGTAGNGLARRTREERLMAG